MVDYIKNLPSNPLLRNYLKILSVDVLAKVSGIILLPVYLKLMTQDEFGLFGYLAAIIGSFSLVFNLGIYTAQSKLYHAYSGPKGDVTFTVNVILFVFISVLLSLLVIFRIDYVIFGFFLKPPFSYEPYRPFVLLGVVVTVYSLMITNYFLTSERFKKVQVLNLIRVFVVNGLVIGVLLFSSSSDNTLQRLKYTYIGEALVVLVFLGSYLKAMRPNFNREVAIKAIKISLPVLFSAILGIFVNLSDRYAIERFGTLKQMSIYNVALSVASVIPFVFASFQNVWLPHFLKEKDAKENQQRASRMIKRLLIFFLIVSAGLLIVLKLLLAVNIIDEKYDQIFGVLPIVLAGTIITSLTQMYSNQLIYMDKLYLVIVAGVPISILAVVLNFQLVPLFNIYGAALSTLAVNACYLLFYSVMVNHYYRKVT